MIVQMQEGHTAQQVDAVCALAESLKLKPVVEAGVNTTVVCLVGEFNGGYQDVTDRMQTMDGVGGVLKVSKPYKLASRQSHRADTVVPVGTGGARTEIGREGSIVLIAGPCSVESFDQLNTIAGHVRAAGAHILRGGAYKPRTSPYAFQGLGVEGLKILRGVGDAHTMPVVTEVMDTRQVPDVERYADMLQIGARNMHNFDLLKEVGQTKKPVLLKRGMSAKYEDLLLSAEYVLSQGNRDVVLCERGVRTFESGTRNMYDVTAVPFLQRETHLPVIVDPSHATGDPALIPPTALAGIAAGAQGVHIEVHHDPKHALSDGPQALLPEKYVALVERMRRVAAAIDKHIPIRP